jgi:hypothetical protein
VIAERPSLEDAADEPPAPAGLRPGKSIANHQPRDVLNTELFDVSCASARMCVAGGLSFSRGPCQRSPVRAPRA